VKVAPIHNGSEVSINNPVVLMSRTRPIITEEPQKISMSAPYRRRVGLRLVELFMMYNLHDYILTLGAACQ
jgi:hypothetical protein